MFPLDARILAGFILFCRTSGCLMMLPGFSNEQIPVRTRLYIALAATAPLAFEMSDAMSEKLSKASVASIALAAVFELGLGLVLGMMARLFILSLETMASAIVMAIGIGNVLGAPLGESTPLPSMADFIVFGATTLIFVTDLHLELIRGLHRSYEFVPALSTPRPEALMRDLLGALRTSWVLVFQISSPFLLFSLIVNLAFGFLNRMAPHVSVYFLAAPLLMISGIYWFYSTSADFFSVFTAATGAWLAGG